MNIKISSNFKKMATKAILAIVLFVCTYLVLITLAVSLTIGLGYLGLMLIILKPMFFTIMIGLGLMSVGVFILIFLFKFIAKKHTVDRSGLHEITANDEPKLFALINAVVNEVGTPFPKKVYLSYDVNAAVFYNSTFWSMFIPVKKNLQIGIGLINSVTAAELKAILAHEFGHFSQKSMKVGSYVHNVNQVIYNLLFDNESYGQLLGKWASASSYFTLFANIAVKITGGIQYVLRKVYVVVNLHYLALSREMEFHADEVAAHVTGATPMISSLLRLELADQTFNSVLDYYGRHVDKCIKTDNFYQQHTWLMNFTAVQTKLLLKDNLPQVARDDMNKFNKSKLSIKDQWSSHPSNEERIAHLQSLGLPDIEGNVALASTLLSNQTAIQETFTKQLFEPVDYKRTPINQTTEDFIDDYAATYEKRSFPLIYNGYYDSRDPVLTPLADVAFVSGTVLKDLFGEEAVELIHVAKALEADIATIKSISDSETSIKTFDYDGERYTKADATDLLGRLTADLARLTLRIEQHDSKILSHFLQLSRQADVEFQYKEKCAAYQHARDVYEKRIALYNQLTEDTRFVQYTTPFDVIDKNFSALQLQEDSFKMELMKIMNEEKEAAELTEETKKYFDDYLNNANAYFAHQEYNQEALEKLFLALANFYSVSETVLFNTKKSLLEYQAGLLSAGEKLQLLSA